MSCDFHFLLWTKKMSFKRVGSKIRCRFSDHTVPAFLDDKNYLMEK